MKKKNKMIKKKEKDVTNLELLQSINKGFSRIEEKMVTKDEFAEVKTDLKSFKTETRESFSKLEKNLKENEESVGAIVADYHPHIIALEEKVFGSSTLAES
jgi:chorismate synthase